jgi:chitodextrinase
MGSRIQSLLQQQVSTGAIPSTDQSALSSAITSIGSTLGAGSTASTAATASTQPTSMQDEVDGMIDQQVSSGKLTGDQATELKGLFAKAHGHMHVHAGGGGSSSSALSDLLSTDDSTTTDPTDATSTTSTASTDPLGSVAQGAGSLVDALASFVNSVRSSVSANGLYGAAGNTAGSLGSLMVNSFA